jgi:PAS domain S-box-containing protein
MFNILCIDDKQENLFTLEQILKDIPGIALYLKNSAEGGLKLLLKTRIDLILLDVQMPYMDGYEAAKLIKSIDGIKDIPIIFITAVFDSKKFENIGYALGAIEYVIKPINDNILQNKVKLYKRISDAEIELRAKNKYIENELNFHKKYLKSIFDSNPNLLVIMDNGVVEDVNKAFLDFFSYENFDVYNINNKNVCDLFVEEKGYIQKEMDSKKWFEYLIDTNLKKINKVIFRKENKKHIFSISMSSFEYDGRRKNIFIFIDITELENIKQRYEYAIKGSSVGLWDWDIKNNCVYFSPKWKEMLGYRDDEIVNEFFEWQDRVHPSDLQRALDDIKQSHENKDIPYKNIHRLRHKDGHWVWILDRGQTYFDSDGNAVRMVGFHTDITELKELEVQLKESKKLFDMFMNNVPYVVVIKDEDHKIIYENKISKIYHKNKTVIGKGARENLGAELGEKIDKISTKAQKLGKAEDVVEYVFDDQTLVFRALAFAIPQENGKVYVGMIYIDITTQKNLADELAQQKELMIAQSQHAAMGEMISMIAHQWRQPISVIAMDANNILVDIELESLEVDSLKEEINNIIEQTQHLSKTIDDFRDFFKPNKDKDHVLVSDVFEESMQVIEKSLVNNNIEIIKDFSDVSKVDIFSREMLQVFLNIIKNAKEVLVENLEDNRYIQNKIYEDDENIIVEISDNGGGINDKYIDKIFDPYFSTKDEKNGTGLGLYMSKIIIEKHIKGSIEVENRDDGAVFIIKIPKERV